jgi:small subunit ribosomal protein S14
MAKKSSIEKNNRRKHLNASARNKRADLKSKIYDKNLSLSERFGLVIKLAAMPRNAARTRIRNRCEITGRSRGYYRKFKLSRHMIRDLSGHGVLPGLIKASW